MKITIFGDSILEGVRFENGKYTRGHELIDSFEAENGVEVENKSKFGSTVDKGLARIEKFLEKERLGDYTVIEFGGNDSAYPWSEIAENPDGDFVCTTPPEKFKELYSRMIDIVYENGSRPIVCTLPPVSSRLYYAYVSRNIEKREAILQWMDGDVETVSRWQQGYSRMVEEMAKDRNCLLLDLRAPFPPYGEELEGYLCSDGMHPNSAGQQLIYRQASKQWKEFIRERGGND